MAKFNFACGGNGDNAVDVGPETFVMSPDHSSPAARITPGCCENAASCSASGSAPPWDAQAAAATGAVAAASLSVDCQQAPANGWVPGRQPALWPLTGLGVDRVDRVEGGLGVDRGQGAAGGVGVVGARDLAEAALVDLGAGHGPAGGRPGLRASAGWPGPSRA